MQRDTAHDVALLRLGCLRRLHDGAEVLCRDVGRNALSLVAADLVVQLAAEECVARGDCAERLVERARRALRHERVELRKRRLRERRLARRLREGLHHGSLDLRRLRGVASGDLRVARDERHELQRIIARKQCKRGHRRAAERRASRIHHFLGRLAHGDAHALAQDRRQLRGERVRRRGILRAREHAPDGVLVAQRERLEVERASRAALGLGLERLRERGDEPLRVRHRLGREERRRTFGISRHQKQGVHVLRDERLDGRRVARRGPAQEPLREVADRLALRLRKLHAREREVHRLLHRLEVLWLLQRAELHRRCIVVGRARLRSLEEQRELVEDSPILPSLEGRFEVRVKKVVRVLGKRRAEKFLELVLLRRRLHRFFLRRRLHLLFLRRWLRRIFRFDLLFSLIAIHDLVRFFVDDFFFFCNFVGVIDDVLDDLVLFAFVAFRDQLGCLRDHPDVVGIAERVVACCADRVFRPVCGAICDVACIVRERVVVELVQEVLTDVRERFENRLRDRPPEAGHGVLREVLVLSRLGQHRTEAILAKELRAARNLVVELFDDLLRGAGELKRQRLVPDLERNDEVRSDHGAVRFARKRNRAERRLHLLGVRMGIADEHVNGGAQRGERLRGAVETRVDAPVPGVAQERVHAVHPQAVRDLHHGGAAVHRRLHRLFA